MDLYSRKSKSIPQKSVIILLEIVLLFLSYWILFKGGGDVIFEKIGVNLADENFVGRATIFVFNLIVFVRMSFMMLCLLKRKIPWEESISVPLAFSLYYIGFSLFVYNRETVFGGMDYFGIILFSIGSMLNTVSELQRHFWKKKNENKGKLFTKGLFGYSMHINYFGDVLWVTAFAIVTHNYYAFLLPIFLFCMFAFWNIPLLDKYLSSKYKEQFVEYGKRVKKFIPFVY